MRRRRPEIPIIDYVSPSVWAWRPGRAHKMRDYVDHVLALLPFEPEAHGSLSGPPCTYVGHPLIERLPWIAALDTAPLAQRLGLAPDTALLVVLPGSRSSEVKRLMQPFGETLSRLIERGRKFEVVMPVVESVRGLVEQHLPAWPKQPHLLEGEEDKFRAFKLARAALAASGTVTLELAAGRHADGRRLQGRCGDRAVAAAHDQGALDRSRQPGAGRERLSRAHPGALHAGQAGERAGADPRREPGARQAARRRWPGFPSACACRRGTPSEAAADIVLDYAESGRGWPRPSLLRQ